jgi:hypothetical protein
MIRPAAFDYNPETAETNRMQQRAEGGAVRAAEMAHIEFDGFVRALESEGIRVCVVEDTLEPLKPDAVFPNNWVSFHEDGTLVLYPMQAENRRLERRREAIDSVREKLGYDVKRLVDLTAHEKNGLFLEGTGSLVLDNVNRVAYACRSPRTHPQVLDEWCKALGYEPVMFDARDRSGVPLYHTNVLMCIGSRAAVIGTEAIALSDRARVLDRLSASGREIIELSHQEIGAFAGNMLELASWDEALGDYTVLVMSGSARDALSAGTFAKLSACTDSILAVPVPTIEKLGGGSVRCMLAEVFLPS